MAFLTIVTRHVASRPRLLRFNQLSLELQSDPDYEQLLLIDEVGRGVGYGNRLVVDHAAEATGQYVMLLDDDDVMINANGVAAIKQAAASRPPAIIFRGWHNDLGVLPDDDTWQQPPQCGHIGSFDFALRRDVWLAHVAAFDNGYAGDFHLIDAVYREHAAAVVWLDTVMCWAIRRSLGRGE